MFGAQETTTTEHEMSYLNETAIRAEYAPYHTMPEFQQGIDYYRAGKVPSFSIPGVAGQAFDRGAECAMRIARAERWIEENVGLN